MHGRGSAVTLASGFDILLGRIEVTVPDVDPADDYSLVREYSRPAIASDLPHADRPVHVQSLAILATSARSSPSPNELQNENGQING